MLRNHAIKFCLKQFRKINDLKKKLQTASKNQNLQQVLKLAIS